MREITFQTNGTMEIIIGKNRTEDLLGLSFAGSIRCLHTAIGDTGRMK